MCRPNNDGSPYHKGMECRLNDEVRLHNAFFINSMELELALTSTIYNTRLRIYFTRYWARSYSRISRSTTQPMTRNSETKVAP